MDVPSDDLFAELLTKQLGGLFGGGRIPGGAGVIRGTIAAASGCIRNVLDGSGLSPARSLVPGRGRRSVSSVWHTEIGRLLYASLPRIGLEERSSTWLPGAPRRVAAEPRPGR